MNLQFSGTYDFSFSEIPFGKINISLEQSEKNYSLSSDIEITGIAKLFTQHKSRSTASGSGKKFKYKLIEYESRYATRKKEKYVKLRQRNGVFTEETIVPPDNRAIRPAVAARDKKNAVDPLSLNIAIRSRLAECIKKSCSSFKINYYDGRRLTGIDFTMLGEKNIRIKNSKYPAYAISAKRQAISGYTNKELSKIGKTEDDPTLYIYYSHDSRLIPLLLELPLQFGTARATLRM